MSSENPYTPPNSDISVSDAAGLAGRGSRLGGAIIDGIIIMLVVAPVVVSLGYWERIMAGEEAGVSALLIGVTGFAAFLVLNGYLLATYGQTIGKRLLGIRIVSVREQELLPLWKLISLRYLPQWVAGQIPVFGQIFGLVDPLFIFRADRRCIHDLIAGTIVVRVDRSPTAQ